jgi:hypothetical protein
MTWLNALSTFMEPTWELWKPCQRGRGSMLDGIAIQPAVLQVESAGDNSGQWHPHLLIALAEVEPSQERLSREWHQITGDSFIVDVRPIVGDLPRASWRCSKYAVKFSDQPVADTWHAFQTLKGKRLLGSAGCFRGVEVPEELTDEPLDICRIELFYRYSHGGYAAGMRASKRRSRRGIDG